MISVSNWQTVTKLLPIHLLFLSQSAQGVNVFSSLPLRKHVHGCPLLWVKLWVTCSCSYTEELLAWDDLTISKAEVNTCDISPRCTDLCGVMSRTWLKQLLATHGCNCLRLWSHLHSVSASEDLLIKKETLLISEVERVQKYSTQVKVPLHYWNFT